MRDFLQRLFEDRDLELPMLSSVAQEVLSLCQRDDVDAERLSEVLHRDQSLASHVLRIANSAMYQATVPIVSLQQAVSRLGLQALSEMAVAVAVHGKLFSRQESGNILKKLWRHSIAAACFCKEIARTRRRNVESAFLCGLLHDVGKPVVLGALLDHQDEIGELPSDVLHVAMEEFHSEVGAMLASRWQMPTAVEESVRYHHDAYHEAPTSAEAVMMTCLADYLAHLVLPSSRRPVEEDDIRDLDVLEALNLYPDELNALISQRDAIIEKVEAIS